MKTILRYMPVLVFSLFFQVMLQGQGWERYHEGVNLNCVTEMQNGDLVYFTSYESSNAGNNILTSYDYRRLDSEGNLLSEKRFFADSLYTRNPVTPLDAGNGDLVFIESQLEYLQDSMRSYPKNTFLKKLNAAGDVLWIDSLSNGEFFGGLEKRGDQGYWLVRTVKDSLSSDNGKKLLIQRLDLNYLPLGEPFDVILPNGITLLHNHKILDDGILIVGVSDQGIKKYHLIKYDLNGNIIWENSRELLNESENLNLTIGSSNEIYVTYEYRDLGNSEFGVGVEKFKEDGVFEDIKLLAVNEKQIEDVQIGSQHYGDSLYISYTRESKLYVVKLSNALNSIWNHQVGFRPNFLYFGLSGIKTLRSGGGVIFGIGLSNNELHTFLIKFDNSGNTLTNNIAGSISINPDSCNFSVDNLPAKDWMVQLKKSGVETYTSTDSTGWFSSPSELGSYQVVPQLKNALWSFCEDSLTSITTQPFENDTLHFVLQPEIDCPSMEVTISTPFLRRCFDNTLYVNYCNEGTIPAQDAYVEITIDPRLEVTGSEIPWSAVNGNVYTFDLGDVDLFECGDFKIYTHLPCDSVELGQTLCLEAHIYPDSICTPPDSLWNGSDLRVSGYCDGDSVRFIIKNEGAALPTQQDFIIIEDDMVMRFGNTTPLGVEETYEVAVPAEGSTYRLQMQQVPGHPWSRKPGVTIENCGQNPIGGTNTGFVTMYEPDDAADFLDVECVEVRGSYDPNDKEAFPKGVCASHFIDNDTEIEYKIRFQNVGNDTAFKVVIKDTLSEFLDPATIEVGVASHPFTWTLSGPGILTFTFDNINLVDKQTNEADSHGFVKYRIAQKPGNAVDTQIKNKAAIYFDFNAPIITNTVEHLVGEDYLVQQTGNLSLAGVVTRDDGQPIDSAKVFLSNNCVTYTDADGKYIFTNLEAGLDYSIWVEKNESHAKGITFLDLLQMRLSILGFDTLGSRYRYFASDVNGSQTTTTLDLVAVGKVMNRVAFEFPNNPICWKFFDGTIPFPNNNGQFPGYQITVTNLQEDKLDNNFIGVKLGDVVYEESLPTVQLNQTLSLGQPTNTCGNVIAVPVVVSGDNLNQVNVVAAEVQYNPAMMELYATSYGDEIFPSNTQLEMGAPGQFIIGFTRSEGFVQKGNSLIVGYLYFVPLAQPGEPNHMEFAENIHPVIVQTTDDRLSEVSLQALDFTYGGGPSWNVNVNTLDVSPCDNVGVEVCLAIQDTSNQFTYLWNTGETTPCIDLNSSANYNCWVTDASGCANLIAGYENVQAPNPMSLDNYQLVDASGANAADGSISGIVISGGSGPYSFYWNDGSTAASRFNLLPGYYEVTITDDLGCNLIQGFTISYASSLITVNEFGFGAAIQPNPTSKGQSAALKILINKTAKLSIEINDVLGRIVYRAEKGIQPGETNLVLPPQKTKGIYLVSIKESGRVLQTIMWSIQ